MPWKIEHKCNVSNPEPDEYAILRTEREGRKVTQVICQNRACRETFIIEGHELFGDAIHSSVAYPGLPPGFLIPSSRRTD